MSDGIAYLIQASIDALKQSGASRARRGIAWLILSTISIVVGLAIWVVLK